MVTFLQIRQHNIMIIYKSIFQVRETSYATQVLLSFNQFYDSILKIYLKRKHVNLVVVVVTCQCDCLTIKRLRWVVGLNPSAV